MADPYRWLEDTDDPQTKAWSSAEDELYASVRATWPGRDGFHARLTQLHAVGEVHAPTWRKDLAFGLRRDPDQDHAVLTVVGSDGAVRTLVDPIAIDPSGSTTLDFWVPSPDGSRLAYGLSAGGTEQALVRVMDVNTGMVIDGPIDRIRHTPIAWLPDGDAYYYVRNLTDEDAPDGDGYLYRRVYLHTVGTPAEQDVLVFGAGRDKTNYYGVSVSRDGRWLVISAAQGTAPRNDVWLADLAGSGPAAPLARMAASCWSRSSLSSKNLMIAFWYQAQAAAAPFSMALSIVSAQWTKVNTPVCALTNFPTGSAFLSACR